MLGLRLTPYNLQHSVMRYDAHTNDSMMNFKKTFLIALTEEIMSNRIAFKNKLAANVLSSPPAPAPAPAAK